MITKKDFVRKWSNWWILAPKRQILDDAFEQELEEVINQEVKLRLENLTQKQNNG
jgi:hypothetical protein